MPNLVKMQSSIARLFFANVWKYQILNIFTKKCMLRGQGVALSTLVYTFFEKIVTSGPIFTGVYNESLIVNTSHIY